MNSIMRHVWMNVKIAGQFVSPALAQYYYESEHYYVTITVTYR